MNATYYEVWLDGVYYEDCATIASVSDTLRELSSMKGVKIVERKVPLTLVEYDGDGNNKYNMVRG